MVRHEDHKLRPDRALSMTIYLIALSYPKGGKAVTCLHSFEAVREWLAKDENVLNSQGEASIKLSVEVQNIDDGIHEYCGCNDDCYFCDLKECPCPSHPKGWEPVK